MKKSTIVLFLLYAFLSINGQSYKPFNLDSGEWFCRYNLKGGMFFWHGTVYAVDSVMFYCSGDTVLADTVYRKLYYTGYTSSVNYARKHISGYYGALRNDTVNKRVLFNHIPIYNFNIKVGDSTSFTQVFSVLGTQYGKVVSIDSVEYCSRYYRRYNVLFWDSTIMPIIEGVGSPDGLFPMGSLFSSLLCYTERDNSLCASCGLRFTGVNENTAQNMNLFIRQTRDHLSLTCEIRMESIEIYNVSGILVYKNPHVSSNYYDVSINSPGMYLLKVKTGNNVIVKKINAY